MSRAIRTLLSLGRITRDQFDQAMLLQARRGGTMGYHLVCMGVLSGEDLVQYMMDNYPATVFTVSEMRDIPRQVIDLIRPNLAVDLRVVPLKQEGKTLTLGITDTSRNHVLSEAQYQTGLDVVPGLVSETDMDWALGHYYSASHGVTLAPEKQGFVSEMPLGFGDISEDDVDVMGIQEPQGAPSAPASRSKRDADSVVMVSSDGWNLDPAALVQEAGPSVFGPSESDFEDELGAYLQEPPVVGGPELPRFDSTESDSSTPSRNSAPTVAVRAPIKVGAPSPTPPVPERDQQVETSEIRNSRELREGEIIAAIHKASSRNEIIGLALDYLRQFAERSAFFVVKKNEIRGFEIAGDLTSRSAIRSCWIPLSADCTLRQVAGERRIHLGPLGRAAADAIMAASLGGRPSRVLIIPVELNGRTVGLIYGDGLHVQMPPWNRLQRLAEVVGENFKRLIIEREPR